MFGVDYVFSNYYKRKFVLKDYDITRKFLSKDNIVYSHILYKYEYDTQRLTKMNH